MATTSKTNSVRNNQVINDFGQKIGGAHKDRAREIAAILRNVEDSALITNPLSKVAKLPNLRGLYQSGVISEEQARRAWWLWAQIGSKPTGYRYSITRWAERAAVLIKAVAHTLAYGEFEKSQLPETFRAYQSWEMFSEEMAAANWPAEDYKRGAYFVDHHWMGKGFAIHTNGNSSSKRYDTVAGAVDGIRGKVAGNSAKGAQAFSVYFSSGVYFISPKGKPGIKLIEFKDRAEAFAAYEDTEKLEKLYNDLRKFPSERRDWNRPRKGEDWRDGRDMTPESFADVFPFRGVEFGNWVNQIERAACLNEAADALHDLAGILGLKPGALALGGTLAWAFGSRGVGKALAHYEYQKKVVNLTKKKGNGCVAHEWFHALDNYLMVGKSWGTLMAVANGQAYGNAEKSPVQEAALALREALQKSDMRTRSGRIDTLKSKPYWATVTEMAARAFEAHIFYKLEAAGMCNDYLVNFKPENEYTRSECYPYPTREEAAELAPLFDAFILAAFTDADRVECPAPAEDPAEVLEVAASEPMDADAPQQPTKAAEGEAYGESEKSQNQAEDWANSIPTLNESIRRKMEAGELSMKEAARQFCAHGWTNFTDEAAARRFMYREADPDLLAYYSKTKAEHPDAVLLYRRGDFYEVHFEDVKPVAECLGITIRRENGAPVAGFPFHALDTYLPRLVRANFRVAICDYPTEPTKPTGTDTPQQPAKAAEGEAYGDAEKSPVSVKAGDIYKVAAADRIVIVLEDDGECYRDTDVIKGRFTGVISRSDKKLFIQCVESGKMVKVDTSALPPVINGVNEWLKNLDQGLVSAFKVRTRKIYEAADAMTKEEKRETVERMGFTSLYRPLDILKAAALHRWNGSMSNYKNCAAIEWLMSQSNEEAAFWMNAGAYPLLFSFYIHKGLAL